MLMDPEGESGGACVRSIHGGLQRTGQVIQTAPGGNSREMRTSKASTPYSPVGFILMTVRVIELF